jgi:S1-C subfamily serine protease
MTLDMLMSLFKQLIVVFLAAATVTVGEAKGKAPAHKAVKSTSLEDVINPTDYQATFQALHVPKMLPAQIYEMSKDVVVQLTSFDAQDHPLMIGTGFFINKTDVLTNYHVVKGASQFRILTYDGIEVTNGTLYTWSEKCDVTIVRFSGYYSKGASGLVPDSNQERVGELIYVVGNPEGYRASISGGLLSAYRLNGAVMQVSAAISPGSSGSPVYNEYGFVIGIIASTDVRGQNLNFVVSANSIYEALGFTNPFHPKGHMTGVTKGVNLQPASEPRAPAPASTPAPEYIDVDPNTHQPISKSVENVLHLGFGS